MKYTKPQCVRKYHSSRTTRWSERVGNCAQKIRTFVAPLSPSFLQSRCHALHTSTMSNALLVRPQLATSKRVQLIGRPHLHVSASGLIAFRAAPQILCLYQPNALQLVVSARTRKHGTFTSQNTCACTNPAPHAPHTTHTTHTPQIHAHEHSAVLHSHMRKYFTLIRLVVLGLLAIFFNCGACC